MSSSVKSNSNQCNGYDVFISYRRTHADWVPELKAANPPAKAITRVDIPGRAGWVSMEP